MAFENRIATGQVREAHAGLESSFGSGGSQSVSTGIKILSSSTMEFQDRQRHDNEEATGSRDPSDRDSGRYQPFPVTIETYARLQPDSSTASSLEALIMAALGATSARTTPAGKTVGAGATTTVIPLTAGHGFELFDAVRIDGETRVVTKVETAQITVAPPLSAAPASGEAITSGRVYHQAAAQPTFWLDDLVDHMVNKGKGLVMEKMTITSPGADRVKFSFSASGADQVSTGTTALSSDVASGATTFAVDNARAFEVGSVFDIGAETEITVTAVDYSAGTITVTRGAGGATTAHSTGDVLTPTWLAPTVTGARAHGMTGAMAVSDGGSGMLSVPATTRSFEFSTGCQMVNDEDGSDAPTYKFDGRRSASLSMTIHCRANDILFLRFGQDQGWTPVVFEITSGSRGLAVFIPRAEFQIPKVSHGDMVDLTIAMDVQMAQDADGNRVTDKMLGVFTW